MKRIIYNYDTPHIVGRKRFTVRAVKGAPLIVAVIALCLVAAAVAAYFLFFKRGQATRRFEYYYLIAGEYENLQAAEAKASQIKSEGGAGYLFNDGKLKVCLFVYPSKADAESVAARLTKAGESVAVTEVTAGGVGLDGADEETFDKFKRLCEFPDEIIAAFYDYSLQLDRSEISESLALYQALVAADKLKAGVFEINELSAACPSEGAFGALADLYGQATEILKGLGTGPSLKAELKYAVCQIVDLYTKFTYKTTVITT